MSSWAEPLPRTTGRVADFLAWRPEWPAVLLVATAWTWLVVEGGTEQGAVPSTTGVPLQGAHHATGGQAPLMTLTTWSVMCLAMMLPLALPALRHVALNSVRGRRSAGMLLFGVGFLAPWLLLGAVALPVAAQVTAGARTPGPVAVVLAVAAGWQVTALKRWAVLSCSRAVPLPPYGPRAWWSRVEFGGRQALRCLAVSWPVLVLMMVLPHGPAGLLAMAALTVAMVAEMRSRHRRRLVPWLGVPLGVAAVVSGTMAL